MDPLFGSAYAPVGDGVADDTIAIQNVLDYNVCDKDAAGVITCSKPCPPPAYVSFPAPRKGYMVSSLRLHANQFLSGTGRADSANATIQGNGLGTAAVIVADNLVTNFTISQLSVASKGVPVLSITNRSSGFNIVESSFVASDGISGGTTAIVMVDSYRGNFTDCYIAQLGLGWAMSLMNNSNAISIDKNIIVGGPGGNGIDIGQSQSVTVRENRIVSMVSGYGVRVAADVAGGGVTTGLTIAGNSFELVAKPISLGEANQVASATVVGNYGYNLANSSMMPLYFIFLGRVTASRISQNYYSGAGVEPFVRFAYVHDALNRVEVPEYMDHSILNRNSIHGVKGFYDSLNFPTGGTQTQNIFAINTISFATDSQAH